MNRRIKIVLLLICLLVSLRLFTLRIYAQEDAEQTTPELETLEQTKVAQTVQEIEFSEKLYNDPYLTEELRKLKEDKCVTVAGDIRLKKADDLDMQQKQAKGLVIENRTADPASPVTGQIWLRVD